MLEFIELSVFERQRERYLDDDEFLQLQAYLAQLPEAGDVIPGSGGCRKLRWRVEGRGKRGGIRVIYFLRLANGQIVLVDLYAKNVVDNVAPGILKKLRESFEHVQDD